jgi:myosin heavy subunit
MKKYLLISAVIPFLFACNQKKVDELESQVNTLAQENAEKQKVINERDAELSDFFTTFNEIESNLEEIKTNEGIVSTNMSGETRTQKDNVKTSIQTLNDLIQENKQLVADLDKKYKNANFKVKELDKMIGSLNEQLGQKEADLLALKGELEKSNYQVATLTTELNTVSEAKIQLETQTAEQATVITEQTESLNTAYYITGSYKELRDKGVVDKEGGFIGIGANKELVNDFDASAFTRIDIRSFTELPLNTKSAKIITPHTSASYTLVEGDKEYEQLQINNPQEFWRTSKYLVVLTD